MKKALTISVEAIVIVAACFGIGYAIGSIIRTMDKAKEQRQAVIGKPEISVENGVMTPEILHSLGYLSDPQMSPDGSKILYGVSYTSIAQNKSCRNLYILDPFNGKTVQISRSAKSLSNARWNADASEIWFIKDSQIWKAPLKGSKLGKATKLSDVKNGVGEFKFSPDFKKILFTTTIPGPVKTPKDLNADLDKANAYVADDLMYRHWDHWVTETPRTLVCSLANKTITESNSVDILGEEPYELPTEPFGGLEQLSWSPDSRFVAYSCRKKMGKEYAFSTNTDIYIYDTMEGSTTQVTWGGGYDTDPAWNPRGDKLAWVSMARDGYEADQQRLMVADIKTCCGSEGGCVSHRGGCHGCGGCSEGGCSHEGIMGSMPVRVGKTRRIAESLDGDVSSPVWTSDGQSILFNATELGLQAIYSADAQSGEYQRITSSEWIFNFGAPFSVNKGKDGCIIYATYQSQLFPSEIVKVSVGAASGPAYEQLSHENDDVFALLGEVKVERVVLDTKQGEKLHCWVLYPPQFDHDKTYPAIEMFEGGPQSCLDQSWSKRWNFRLMAQQGYVVVLPNRHGVSGFGQAWKEQISGDYQGLNMQDYMTAGRWAKSQKWCGKLAGVGASYGGFSVYNMMGIHGNLYDCFISHAGIFNEKMMWYTTEEAWFGNWDNGGLTEYEYEPGQTGPKGDGITFGGMQQAGAPYASTAKCKEHYNHDPETRVCNWHTPILCIHGMMDFRIPYEQGMAAFNAAQMMGVPSRLVVFPEENHWIIRPQNCIFWQREFFSWLDQWCK